VIDGAITSILLIDRTEFLLGRYGTRNIDLTY
jgi:hypothetical protein